MKKTPLKRKTPLKKKRVKSVPAILKKEQTGRKLDKGQVAKAALATWAKIVKLNCNYRCEWCGDVAIHAHHMIAKAQGNTLKYSEENGVGLCYKCHVTFHQKDSYTGWEKFKQDRPLSFEYVVAHMNDTTKLDVFQLREIYDKLKVRLKELEG